MIILDENFPESQRQLLRGWRVPPIRQIGYEVGRSGMQDAVTESRGRPPCDRGARPLTIYKERKIDRCTEEPSPDSLGSRDGAHDAAPLDPARTRSRLRDASDRIADRGDGDAGVPRAEPPRQDPRAAGRGSHPGRERRDHHLSGGHTVRERDWCRLRSRVCVPSTISGASSSCPEASSLSTNSAASLLGCMMRALLHMREH